MNFNVWEYYVAAHLPQLVYKVSNTNRDQSILLFFSPIFLSSNSFFLQPIMLNILLQALYYAQDFAQNLTT